MDGSKFSGGRQISGTGRRPCGRMTPGRCGAVWCGQGQWWGRGQRIGWGSGRRGRIRRRW